MSQRVDTVTRLSALSAILLHPLTIAPLRPEKGRPAPATGNTPLWPAVCVAAQTGIEGRP
jgi:hypothetical protein